MKRAIALLCLSLLLTLGCTNKPNTPQVSRPEIPEAKYTSYNIWKHDSTVFCINFKTGQNIITAGTEVDKIRIVEDKQLQSKYLKFRIVESGEQITVRFISRWHPGESIYTYKAKMFTHENFEQITEGLSSEEKLNIKKGEIHNGMSKRAVLISYGPPPEHVNKDLSSDKWVYWENKLKRKYVCFDKNGKVSRCWL